MYSEESVKSQHNAADALTKAVGGKVIEMFNEQIGALKSDAQGKAAVG